MNNSGDAIFALATANLRSALHLHRLSGNGVFSLLSPYLFFPKSSLPVRLDSLVQGQNHPVTRYIHIQDELGSLLDDVILTCFPNPHSFTGEDVVEISTHGNPLVSAKLHSLFRKIGMREAKPGEFTQRAVLYGKLDLAQAEGIHELICAESFGALDLARNNMVGILSQETLAIREELIALSAYLEAHIDFAPDEVGHYDAKQFLPQVYQIKNKLISLSQTYENGLKIREGVKIVLAGKPNSGKSSLYNALLKQEKAIVTNIPGTTRDVLEDKLLIENKEFVLLDTAGIRSTSDEVEKIGVSRTFENLKKADIICYLISAPDTDIHSKLFLNEIKNFLHEGAINFQKQKILVVFTKKDLFSSEVASEFFHKAQSSFLNEFSSSDESVPELLFLSQSDFDDLKKILLQFYSKIFEKTDTRNSPMLISQRQKDKVLSALQFIQDSERLMSANDFPEKIASLLQSARVALEEIVGEISVDNVFEKVFSSFCIGK